MALPRTLPLLTAAMQRQQHSVNKVLRLPRMRSVMARQRTIQLMGMAHRVAPPARLLLIPPPTAMQARTRVRLRMMKERQQL